MACYKPLSAWRGPMQANGKSSIVFDRRASTSPVELRLPCGQCIGCRLERSFQWAIRCLNEAQMHDRNCFITVTYSPENLPKDGGLHVEDWQRFVKRLRKKVGRFRFFHAGEYGERFGRPHYHSLMFGYRPGDLKFLKRTDSGAAIYSSEELSGVWGRGYCSVGDLTFESAAYVARYCLKKITGEGALKDDDRTGLKPYERVDLGTGEVRDIKSEYVTMSRRPGIGKSWYEKFKSDVYPAGYVTLRGGVKRSPPRYYDSQYELENPVDMERIKLHRLERANKKELVYNDVLKKFQLLEVGRPERLKVMEEVKTKTMSRFSRGGKVESVQ